FLGHAPGVMVLPHPLDRSTVLLDRLAAPLQPDQVLDVLRRRTPEVVILVGANRPGQPESRPKEIDRACLPIVARDNAGAGSLIGREGSIDSGDILDQLRPPELIAQTLLERAAVMDLGLGRGCAESLLVGEELLRRKDRKNRGSDQDAGDQ